jgi:hypothetical protein
MKAQTSTGDGASITIFLLRGCRPIYDYVGVYGAPSWKKHDKAFVISRISKPFVQTPGSGECCRNCSLCIEGIQGTSVAITLEKRPPGPWGVQGTSSPVGWISDGQPRK